MILPEPESWSLLQGSLVFAACAVVITIVGVRITRVVDQLADRTGIGEAAAGAVLLGAATSLGGSVLSVTAAWNGHVDLALGNALGGIAVQTFFLVIADLAYRKANLEHAAASAPNMMQAGLLICLLALILIAPTLPDVTVLKVHPVTPLLFGFYLYGLHTVQSATRTPMWRPNITQETREDEPDDTSTMPSAGRLWIEFLLFMVVLGGAGWTLESAATVISSESGLSHTVIGILFTSVSTSIPELVTSIAAVRRGALTLAVGGIIGGNAFDTLFAAASDVAYRDGSIYHAMSSGMSFWIALSVLMSGVLLMGLIRREKHGVGGIGVESVTILVLYVAGVSLLISGQLGNV